MTGKCNPPLEHSNTLPLVVPENPRAEVVFWCQWAVKHQDRFRYTMGSERSQMFDNFDALIRTKLVIKADCSQFAASILHHVGVKKNLNNQDYTGTLLQKGTRVAPSKAKPGDVIIFGPGTGTHAAIKTYSGNCIGFGHWPGAPNRMNIVTFSNWFASHGHPGVRYLSFL